MSKYINEQGYSLINVDDEYIIIDKQEQGLECHLFTEELMTKFINAGYTLDRNGHRKSIGSCVKCGQSLYEGNRVKVRDYYECPKCNNFWSREDIVN